MPVHVGSRDLVPLILNLGCRWRCLVRITSHTLHPFDVPQYVLNIKLGGPQSQAGYYREEKIFSPCQDSNSTSSSPEPGHISNYTIPAQYCKLSKSLLTTNCMKQGVPQLFNKLPALYVTSPCSAIIKTSQTSLCFIRALQNFNIAFKNCKFAHL
jgi:hypothetical protein